jgi:hypothetical protein
LIKTLRDKYGNDFAEGYRSDAKLGTVLEREGLDDLSRLLKKKRGGRSDQSYSMRSASMGANREACQAGIKHAKAATSESTRVTAANTVQSSGCTS